MNPAAILIALDLNSYLSKNNIIEDCYDCKYISKGNSIYYHCNHPNISDEQKLININYLDIPNWCPLNE